MGIVINRSFGHRTVAVAAARPSKPLSQAAEIRLASALAGCPTLGDILAARKNITLAQAREEMVAEIGRLGGGANVEAALKWKSNVDKLNAKFDKLRSNGNG